MAATGGHIDTATRRLPQIRMLFDWRVGARMGAAAALIRWRPLVCVAEVKSGCKHRRDTSARCLRVICCNLEGGDDTANENGRGWWGGHERGDEKRERGERCALSRLVW